MIRFAEMHDLDRVMEIQQAAYDEMDQRWLSVVEREAFIKGIHHGWLAVKLVDSVVAGFRMLWVPQEDYLGEALGIKRAVIYFDISVVHPDFRGNNIQLQLGKWLYVHVIEPGNYKWVLSTVHPANIASMKDKFRLDMFIGYYDQMYGENMRYIFIRDDVEWCGCEVAVHVNDLQKISELLISGFYGRRLEGNYLIFDRIKQEDDISITHFH